jgi:hypothetical protein
LFYRTVPGGIFNGKYDVAALSVRQPQMSAWQKHTADQLAIGCKIIKSAL